MQSLTVLFISSLFVIVRGQKDPYTFFDFDYINKSGIWLNNNTVRSQQALDGTVTLDPSSFSTSTTMDNYGSMVGVFACDNQESGNVLTTPQTTAYLKPQGGQLTFNNFTLEVIVKTTVNNAVFYGYIIGFEGAGTDSNIVGNSISYNAIYNYTSPVPNKFFPSNYNTNSGWMATEKYWNSTINSAPINITKFYHVIVTQNNVGLVSVYVNGVQYGTSYTAIGGAKDNNVIYQPQIKICGGNTDNVGFDGFVRAFGFYTTSFESLDAANACVEVSDMVDCDTLSPTLDVTNDPTLNPTIDHEPTIDPTSVASEEEPLEYIDNIFQYANIVIIGLFLFIGLTGFIDAKFLRINDVFSVGKIIQPLLHSLDAMSDIFLCWEVSLIYEFAKENTDKSIYLVLLICMAMFILIPIIFSLIQLAIISNKYWINDKNESALYVLNSASIKIWFTKYAYFLYITSVITGSSFSATSLFNSNLYGLAIFDMGLSESTLSHFKTKRIYSVILCENIPQLILQFIYWTITNRKSMIVIVSMIYSMISILVTLMTIYTQRRIIYMQQAVCIRFDVVGCSISKNAEKLRNRFRGVRKELSKLFGVEKTVIEVTRPNIISNGIRMVILIKIDGDINEQLLSFKQSMYDTNDSVLNAIKKGWELDDVNNDDNVKISNIKLSVKESKKSIQETKHIQLSTLTNDHQETESNAKSEHSP